MTDSKYSSGQIPAIYPVPSLDMLLPTTVAEQVDMNPTVTFEGPTAADLLRAGNNVCLQRDLSTRLHCYAKAFVALTEPYCGDRPDHVSLEAWRNPEQRAARIGNLPKESPAEAHFAALALKYMYAMMGELHAAANCPTRYRVAICWAIELGKLLERVQIQIDHGLNVETGKRILRATKVANAAKRQTVEERKSVAYAEFQRRMGNCKGSRMKTATLKNMSKVMDDSVVTPKHKWGSLRTLMKYAKDW